MLTLGKVLVVGTKNRKNIGLGVRKEIYERIAKNNIVE